MYMNMTSISSKGLERTGFIFFVLTYVALFIWLYRGVTSGYDFCLPSADPFNLLAILAGVCGVITLAAYSKHSRGSLRALGIITFTFGVSVALAVALRFFTGISIC